MILKLILKAIKSLFWKLECKIEEFNTNNNETMKSLQAEITALQKQAPLMIKVGYDAIADCDICDTPYAEIEEAFLSGRPVMMNNSCFVSSCITGKYVVCMTPYYINSSGTFRRGIIYTIINSSEIVETYIDYTNNK